MSEKIKVSAISRDELTTKINRGDDFALVETLPEMYYRHTHLPQAVNVPFGVDMRNTKLAGLLEFLTVSLA